MHKNLRVLIPWYQYPPFSRGRVGGLSVAIWELSRNLAKLGLCEIAILTPPSLDSKKEEFLEIGSQHGIKIHRNEVGKSLLRGRRLDSPTETQFLHEFDRILSIENFGAMSLARDPVAVQKTMRQVHTIAADRKLSDFESLSPGSLEHLKMYFQRRKLVNSEIALRGIRTICVSNFVVQRMLELSLEIRENLFRVPNGIDVQTFLPMKNREITRDLIFVGRFQKSKGLDILIDSLNILSKKGRSYNLGIVGEFSENERNVCLSHAVPEVREKIEFLGTIPHEDLPSVLNSSRLLVAPSRYESFSLPVLEALACGIPVVATNVGGIPELVEQGLGILVESPSPDSLARAIVQAVGNESLAAGAGSLGPQKASKYDWKVVAPKFADLL